MHFSIHQYARCMQVLPLEIHISEKSDFEKIIRHQKS